MANKIQIGSGATGQIKLNGGIIFFGVPEEGDKFIITCTSAALNIYPPGPDSLRLCLEDIHYEVDEQALNLFESSSLYDTPVKVATFLYDQFNANLSFKALYNISRNNNIITITKKINTHFIGECKLVIQNTVPVSSIRFTQTISPHPNPKRYIKFILSIDGIELSKSYISSPVGNDIPPTTIATDFKTLFDTRPTLSNNYTMIRDGAILTVKNNSLMANRPIITLEKDFQHSSLTYKYTGTLSALDGASVTFNPYSDSSSFKFTVVFTPPNPALLGWQYNKIYEALMDHPFWQGMMNDIDFITGTVAGATLSFTLVYKEDTNVFYKDGDVDTPKHNWSFHEQVDAIPLYNYTGYTINNDAFIPYYAPEFTYEEQLIRGWVG